MGLFSFLCISASIFLFTLPKGQCANIIGGKESVPHSRPYMAALTDGKQFSCGGTLIKGNWVLTAAHCFPSQNTYVVLGAHSQTKRENEKQFINITRIFVYPGFNLKTLENDIMLLQLQKKAKFNQAVKTIQLVRNFNDVKAGTQCLISGWGKIVDDDRAKLSDTLREVNVTVLERKLCNDKEHYNSKPPITINMVCAGDKKGGKDACQGDSGGPLICDNEQKGIISFGKSCGSSKFPGVYTRLTKTYMSWIKKTTGGDRD